MSTKKADFLVETSPEMEFDMWDGQFEFVGNSFVPVVGPNDLNLPKIRHDSHDNRHVVNKQKVKLESH